MRKGDAELRLFACQAAGLIEAPELIDPLILALRDDSEWVRTYAAISLGKTGDTRALIPLIRSFSDRNTDVHRSVKQAFDKLGGQVFQELIRCIEGEDNELRSNAAKALAELREERGIDHIIMLLEDTDDKVRAAAAEALGSFPGVKSRAVLQDALNDASLPVRLATVKSFGEMNSEADVLMLMHHAGKAKDQRETRTIKRTLNEMAQANPDLFINLFTNEQSSVKSLALEALVGAGIDALARLTQVAAEAKDDTLVFWCKKAIKQIKSPKESMFYG
jgi:HEAT repeat protein